MLALFAWLGVLFLCSQVQSNRSAIRKLERTISRLEMRLYRCELVCHETHPGVVTPNHAPAPLTPGPSC